MKDNGRALGWEYSIFWGFGLLVSERAEERIGAQPD